MTPALTVNGPRDPLRRASLGLILLLLLQTMLGMVTNLYVTVPAKHPGAHAGHYFSGVLSGVPWVIGHGPAELALHALLGLALAIASVAALALAVHSRRRIEIALAGVAAAAIIGAGFNGASFLNYGHDVSSLIMTGSALLSIAAYAFILSLQQTANAAPAIDAYTWTGAPDRQGP